MIKKTIIVCLLLFCYIKWITISVEGEALKKIQMNLKLEDLGITFISESKAKFLLISTKEESALVLLKRDGNIDLQKQVKSFPYSNIHSLIISENISSTSYDFDSFKLFTNNYQNQVVKILLDDKKMILKHKNYRFCALMKKEEILNNCDFLYILDTSFDKELEEQLKIVFYDENIPEKVILKNYNNWIDTVRMSNLNYTTLLFTDNTYNVVQIPKNQVS